MRWFTVLLFTTTMLCGYKAPNQSAHRVLDVEVQGVVKAADQYNNICYIVLTDIGNFRIKGHTELHTVKIAANLKIGPKKRKILLHVYYFNLADGNVFTYSTHICNAFTPVEK